MEDLIEKIRTATLADATDEARAGAAQACRTLLTALETKPGELMRAATPPAADLEVSPSLPSATPHAAAQAIASALRGVTPDQLLDMAIARLRAALPTGSELSPVQPLKFHLVPIAR